MEEQKRAVSRVVLGRPTKIMIMKQSHGYNELRLGMVGNTITYTLREEGIVTILPLQTNEKDEVPESNSDEAEAEAHIIHEISPFYSICIYKSYINREQHSPSMDQIASATIATNGSLV